MAARTSVRQSTQVRASDTYDDTLDPATRSDLETAAANIQEDLNALRSVINKIMRNALTGNWYDDVPSLANIDGETKQRGLSLLNTDLDDLELKRVLCRSQVLTDISVAASENWVILNVSSAEAPTQVSAIGAGTDRGAVTALSAFSAGAFEANEIIEVAGENAASPKNLVIVRDAANGKPILSSNRAVYGLVQSENTATNGTAFDDVSGGDRVKLSFIRQNAAFDGLEACPVGDIASKTINYVYVFRDRLEDFLESCLLGNENFLTPGVGGGGASIPATKEGQVLYSEDGSTFVPRTPITGNFGWMINEQGQLLVRG